MPVAKENSGNFKPAPEGTHLARCFAVVSLGTQKQNNPQFLDSFKVMLFWELPDELIQGEKESFPMTISKEYSLSLGKKANLRRDLESWRGRGFTDEELKGFDVAKLVGHSCLLSISHRKNAKGNVYAEIKTVAKPMKGQECKPQHHASVVYEVEEEKTTYAALPQWIQKKIDVCEEWTSPPIKKEELPPANGLPAEPPPEDDDVPF